MTEPDELYTLRAQYWLGHYQMAVEEAKSVARRPMNPALKAEREEFLARALTSLGQGAKVMAGDSAALQALALKAQYESAAAGRHEVAQAKALDALKSLAGGASDSSPNVQLYAAQTLLVAGSVKEALALIHAGATLEQQAVLVQIYLQLDRLDLARQQLHAMRTVDEDSILTQLSSVVVNLATGSSAAADAVHTLNMLTEQYGGSPLLLNLMAAALMQQHDYAGAEIKLHEALQENIQVPDTLINLICASVQQNKAPTEYLQQMYARYPTHAYLQDLERVTAAFDREAVKYKV